MICMNYLPRCSAASETDARDVSYESESSRDVVYDSDIGQKLSPLGSNSSIQVSEKYAKQEEKNLYKMFNIFLKHKKRIFKL